VRDDLDLLNAGERTLRLYRLYTLRL